MTPGTPPTPPADRLDSWKEIAAYLNRDITTAQRWERQEGLPVHRLPHAKQGSVFGFRHELDAWRDARAQRSAAPTPVPPPPTPVLVRANWLHLVLGGLVVAAVLTAVSVASSRHAGASVPFRARDWLLVASFDNRTGERLLDGTVEAALEDELAQSTYANVIPHERIDDALKLMERGRDTRVDESTAREIALRDGAIRAIVAGSIERVGQYFVIEARLVRPGDGQLLGAVRREVTSMNGVLPALSLVASDIRRAIGEGLPPVADPERLERVTTSSLQALQLYSRAVSAGESSNWLAAEPLLRDALRIDPGFAAAHNWMGWTLFSLHPDRPSEFLPEFRTAMELSQNLSDPERYFFAGGYYERSGRNEEALAAYSALLAVQPDHFWASNNAGFTASRLGKWRESVSFYERASDLRPHACAPAARSSYYAAVYQADLSAARKYHARALAAASSIGGASEPDVWSACGTMNADQLAWVRTFPAVAAVADGNAEDALAQVAALDAGLRQYRGEERSALAASLSDIYASLGRLDDSERLAVDIERGLDAGYLGAIAYERGDIQRALEMYRKLVAQSPGRVSAIGWLVRLGMLQGARAELEKVLARKPTPLSPALILLARGHIDAASGKRSLARDEFERGLEQLRGSTTSSAPLAAQALAEIYLAEDDLHGAIRVLEQESNNRIGHTVNGTLDLWMFMREDLAALYRKAGRDGDADAVEAELRKLLAKADRTHVLMRRLEAVSASNAQAAAGPHPANRP